MSVKKITLDEAENLAKKLRSDLGLSLDGPIHTKTILRKENILTAYRPMSIDAYGLSLKCGDYKFMLINSNNMRGRQHFTIAHELYHLYLEDNPKPHLCTNGKSPEEYNADLFASAFLMPVEGIYKNIPTEELREKQISLATIIRLEQYFSVSRLALLVRLDKLKLLKKGQFEVLKSVSPMQSAREHGYDLSLYKKGNEDMFIGDFGTIARRLFDDEKISEGHYVELLNQIGANEED